MALRIQVGIFCTDLHLYTLQKIQYLSIVITQPSFEKKCLFFRRFLICCHCTRVLSNKVYVQHLEQRFVKKTHTEKHIKSNAIKIFCKVFATANQTDRRFEDFWNLTLWIEFAQLEKKSGFLWIYFFLSFWIYSCRTIEKDVCHLLCLNWN